MTAKQILKAILSLAKAYEKTNKDYEEISRNYPFDEMDWSVGKIYYNCKIDDGILYDENGDMLSNDGNCMDEDIPYFVNQTTGYLGDDYYGTMFVKVDDNNTFVSIGYSC